MTTSEQSDEAMTSQARSRANWPSLISEVSIVGKSEDFDEPVVKSAHMHAEGQLIYAASGVVAVGEVDGYWVVPPTRAVWLPPGTQHWARSSANVRLRTVLIGEQADTHMPRKSCVIHVSAVMREIIIALALRPATARPSELDQAMLRVLALQLQELPALPLHLPALRDQRLVQIEKHVLANAHDRVTLAEWASALGLDQRTLHRLFMKDAGISFSQWLQQAHLLQALEWLAEGRKVIDIATNLGYSSHSAFSLMFRKNLGVAPRDFFSQDGAK